jgi:predicted nucleotidyltransferase
MADPRTTAAKLTAHLRRTFGEGLHSVVLFGSVPRGEAVPGVSDLNVLVLLESLAPTNLARAAPVLQEWIRHGNTPPHLYSSDEWAGMADTFAIEIADMQDAREVLAGVDPITAGSVTNSDLRLHTEREIRETLLHLRLRLLLGANSPVEVGNLLLSGLPSFTAYMRAALRLGGSGSLEDSRDVIERVARLIDADATPMLTCWQHRRTLRPLEVPITDPLVEEYTAFTRRLVTFLDRPAQVLRGEPSEPRQPAHH